MKKTFGIFLLCAMCFFASNAQTTFYNTNTLQKIEIFFSIPDWDYRMDTAKHGAEGYLMCDSILINGLALDSVGVKYKGNSSYDSTRKKNPMHIRLDKYKNHDYEGYEDIKLSNGYGDPSLMREVLSYSILKNYMHCPLSNFVELYINGNYIGLYSSAEDINKKFLSDHFYSNQGTFVKCNPIVNPGPTTKSNFRFLGTDSSLYNTYYEIKSNAGWSDLVSLCDSVTNNTYSYENMLDVDRVLWMLAFNNLFVNLDSYSGVFAQNHYIFRDHTQHYNPIIWDLNMCFGAFPFAGVGPTSMGNQTPTSMQQFAIDNHGADDYWPLIKGIQSNATWKRKYVAHMKTMLQEQVVNNNYVMTANQYMSLINSAVNNDVNKFYTYAQYQNSLTTDIPNGAYTIPGISNLMTGRATYLNALPEFTATAPTISNINPSNPNPNFNSTVTLNVTITNANDAYIGYRFDKKVKFEKIQLYDDGLHNDGTANDNIYGTDIVMQGAVLQYYIYAENNNAGMFSPQRAEHEYHKLKCQSVQPTVGSIVINELLAQNDNSERDEYNDKEDWLEIYNNSNNTIDLSNVYLTNKWNNLLKWKIPNETYITPNGYITIWADNDSLEQILHTNFNLSKDTGFLAMSLPNGTLLDSVSFFNQTADVSYGRYPNGTGNFIPMNRTFGYENNNFPIAVNNIDKKEQSIFLYPNPAQNYIYVLCNGKKKISIYNTVGVNVMNVNIENQYQLDISHLSSGMYILKADKQFIKFSVIH